MSQWPEREYICNEAITFTISTSDGMACWPHRICVRGLQESMYVIKIEQVYILFLKKQRDYGQLLPCYVAHM